MVQTGPGNGSGFYVAEWTHRQVKLCDAARFRLNRRAHGAALARHPTGLMVPVPPSQLVDPPELPLELLDPLLAPALPVLALEPSLLSPPAAVLATLEPPA
jgi:hypothetical protein